MRWDSGCPTPAHIMPARQGSETGMTNHIKHGNPARRAGSDEERRERAAAGYSRPPLARMMRLHERLIANRFPNCRKMAQEFEVSTKTVQRDVNFMRDQMGLPIEYDKARFGFHYTRPVSGFPAEIAAGRISETASRHPALAPVGERPPLSPAGPEGMAVRIGFDRESATAVRAGIWHPTQLVRSLPGGAVEMTLRVREESEIVGWVLSWGAHAWVIDPPRLRNRIREVAREILARH